VKRKMFYYFTPLPNGSFANEVETQPLPTYPYSMRFKSYDDMLYYRDAKKQFIQSTKIPIDCDRCPLGSMCSFITYMDDCCSLTWKKIWEYVK
jgi:hypothetical protein